MRDDPLDWWRKALVSTDATVADVIRNLDESALQIALISAPDGTLIGTITDGDIRRGLLRGLSLQSPAMEIVSRDPLVVPSELAPETVLGLMQVNKIHQLPVVDDNRRVVGLHVWSELIDRGELSNLMVIMAGGEGSRLRPHTETCPKPLLPVAGKPILEHILERALAQGFRDFRLAIRYLGHMIEAHFADGRRWKANIDYLREEAPLGTAGALRLLAPRPERAFVVTNGDVLTSINYAELLEFHARHGAGATMAVRLHEWQHPFGVVRTDGVDIIGFDEKPISRSYINAGVYVLEPHVLDLIEEAERCDMPTLFARAQQAGARAIVYPMHEPWLDIGRADDWERAQGRK